MDDLLDNFAKIDSPNIDEEGYIYHFVNESPPPLEHNRPVHDTTEAEPNNYTSFFNIESPPQYQFTGGENEDEGDYNADIDDDDYDDDDVFGCGLQKTSQLGANRESSTIGASHNKERLFMNNNTTSLNHSYQTQSNGIIELHDLSGRNDSGDIKPSSALSGDEQDLDAFKQHLRKFHRQDLERDELLAHLFQEVLDLKTILKDSVPGGNSRAEAAERSLFEIRKSCDISPYVCVLVDGRGYKIHEDLLQLGKEGGLEAANRLHKEVSSYLQQFSEAQAWEIMVHLYVDVGGLLARCVTNDIPLSDSCVRGFMLGFAQAQPLFNIMDVGRGQDGSLPKVEAMFHLFANNIQCKHLIFGCCHDAAYIPTLERYTCDPIIASGITLLKSYEVLTSFKDLSLEFVEFPSVFRPTPYKETDRLGEDIDLVQDLQQETDFNHTPQQIEKDSAKKEAGANEAIAKWQASAGTSWPVLAPTRPPAKAFSGWGMEKKVLLNINDERVDQELGEVDYDTSESMLDRIEERRFCLYYHLQNSCVAHLAGKPCNYRHEPRLNEQELRFLKRESQRRPCGFGSRCRKPDCVYGHVCPHQPGCERGPACALYNFHDVDKTAVKVWSPEKRLSPRKRLSRT